MTRQHILEFAYLWDGSSSGWVLVHNRDDERDSGYSVFNEETNMILLIEDEGIQEAVCARLLSLGVKVLDQMPSGQFNVDNLDIETRKGAKPEKVPGTVSAEPEKVPGTVSAEGTCHRGKTVRLDDVSRNGS